jgi:hypothetical protein
MELPKPILSVCVCVLRNDFFSVSEKPPKYLLETNNKFWNTEVRNMVKILSLKVSTV